MAVLLLRFIQQHHRQGVLLEHWRKRVQEQLLFLVYLPGQVTHLLLKQQMQLVKVPQVPQVIA
jgi:hypothetical protein